VSRLAPGIARAPMRTLPPAHTATSRKCHAPTAREDQYVRGRAGARGRIRACAWPIAPRCRRPENVFTRGRCAWQAGHEEAAKGREERDAGKRKGLSPPR
jgi:hypothetical protein